MTSVSHQAMEFTSEPLEIEPKGFGAKREMSVFIFSKLIRDSFRRCQRVAGVNESRDRARRREENIFD